MYVNKLLVINTPELASFLIRELIFFPFHFFVASGWVVSALLAGATVGSFTGGSLADKFGRTKTFVLDAIPLAVGTFLWFVSKLVS